MCMYEKFNSFVESQCLRQCCIHNIVWCQRGKDKLWKPVSEVLLFLEEQKTIYPEREKELI